MGLETGLKLGQKVITAWVKTGASRSMLAMRKGNVNINELKLAPIGDTFVSNKTQLTSKILPLKCVGSECWRGSAKTIDGKHVGSYRCSVMSPHLSIPSNYPKGWMDLNTGLPKKSLFIDLMNTQCAEHQGYGREMMKRFYLHSIEIGCEGRISLESAWNSGGFYKKLGFEVCSGQAARYEKELAKAKKALRYIEQREASGETHLIPEGYKEDVLDSIEHYSDPIGTGDCLLFFTPTPENIAKLFSK